jgi:hypothetical protein
MLFDKVRHIELFGVSGSGKTYIRDEIIKILKKSNLQVLNRKELITLKYRSVIKLNFLEKLTIYYFRLLEFVKKKSKIGNKKKILVKKINLNHKNSLNIFSKLTINLKDYYENICIKILLKNHKSKKIYKFLLRYLKKSNIIYKKNYHFWFVELLAAQCIYEKIKFKSNFIYFPDEGFIQRTFLINSLTGAKNANIIREYLKIIFKADLIFNITSKIDKIYKRHSQRKTNKTKFYLDKEKIDKMLKFEKKLTKIYINFKFETIKNNSNLKNFLNNKLVN